MRRPWIVIALALTGSGACASPHPVEDVVVIASRGGRPTAEGLVARGAVTTTTAEDGTLTLSGGPGYVHTTSTWRDVAVKVEVRAGTSNSGLFVRGAHPGLGFFPIGPEVQIEHAGEPWSTGAIYGQAASAAPRPAPDAWVELCVIARGDKLTAFVDGARASSATVAAVDGFIAVQGHDPFGRVSVRGLRIRPLTDLPSDDEQACRAAW